MVRKSSVYLLDVSTYKPPEELKANVPELHRVLKTKPGWSSKTNEETLEFQRKVVTKAGLKMDSTYIPKSIHPAHVDAPDNGTERAMEEAQMSMCGAVQQLLDKSGVKPKEIDILITVCSVFCPTPSLGSMIMNKFEMRSDVHSYSLGGMGCGNGVVAINLARDMLKAHPNSLCLFVVTENVTAGYYAGIERQRLIANTIFRMGGAAVLMTNKRSLKRKAKYKLMQAVRVHTAQDDDAYKCIDYSPDDEGHVGIKLTKAVVEHASTAVSKALRIAIPRMLSARQLCAGGVNIVKRKYLKKDIPEYIPDLTKCCQHYLIHAGSSKVIDSLRKNLNLPPEYMIPSMGSLKEYGNTSGSSTWYALTFIENFQGLKKGQKVMQVGMGSGMKAGVNVWKAVRSFKDSHVAWAHLDYAEFNKVEVYQSGPPKMPETVTTDKPPRKAVELDISAEKGTKVVISEGDAVARKLSAKTDPAVMGSDSSTSSKISSVPSTSYPQVNMPPPTAPPPQAVM